MMTGIVCPLYGISLFLPSIIRGLGYTSSTAQLLTVPIYITASVLAVAVAWYSDRVGKRYPFILVCLCVMAVGFIMCVASATPGVIYAGVFIAACALYPAFPGNITWLSNSASCVQQSEHIKRANCISRPGWIHQASHRAGHPDRCWQSCWRYVAQQCYWFVVLTLPSHGLEFLQGRGLATVCSRARARARVHRRRYSRVACTGIQLQAHQQEAGAADGRRCAQRVYARGAGSIGRSCNHVSILLVAGS
jgi:hypothetical protein